MIYFQQEDDPFQFSIGEFQSQVLYLDNLLRNAVYRDRAKNEYTKYKFDFLTNEIFSESQPYSISASSQSW